MQEMRSTYSGFLAGLSSWGCLCRADTVIPLGAFGVGTGLARGWLGWLWGSRAVSAGGCLCARRSVFAVQDFDR